MARGCVLSGGSSHLTTVYSYVYPFLNIRTTIAKHTRRAPRVRTRAVASRAGPLTEAMAHVCVCLHGLLQLRLTSEDTHAPRRETRLTRHTTRENSEKGCAPQNEGGGLGCSLCRGQGQQRQGGQYKPKNAIIIIKKSRHITLSYMQDVGCVGHILPVPYREMRAHRAMNTAVATYYYSTSLWYLSEIRSHRACCPTFRRPHQLLLQLPSRSSDTSPVNIEQNEPIVRPTHLTGAPR